MKINQPISIVIPAFNEEKRIKKTLKQITKYLKDNYKLYEIIIVDDGSSDNTVKIAESFKEVKVIKNNRNRGKGYSVRHGMLAAKEPLILFSDADLSTPIEELKEFHKYTKDYGIIIGSRNMNSSNIEIKQPFIRSRLGKLFPFFVNLFVIRGIKDTQCGFKLMTKDAVKKIIPKMKEDGFAFDVELLYLAKKAGYKIKEVPVTWRNDAQSKVNIFRDVPRMFISLIKMRLKKH